MKPSLNGRLAKLENVITPARFRIERHGGMVLLYWGGRLIKTIGGDLWDAI